jgi:hypothetical protein
MSPREHVGVAPPRRVQTRSQCAAMRGPVTASRLPSEVSSGTMMTATTAERADGAGRTMERCGLAHRTAVLRVSAPNR